MDAHTEQAYQQRIVKLELQNTSLEACVSDLTRQLAERNEQLAQRDATIAALQQQVAELSKQVTDLLAQVARLSKNSSNSCNRSRVKVAKLTGKRCFSPFGSCFSRFLHLLNSSYHIISLIFRNL